MAVHPCHIVTLVFIFICAVFIASALRAPWTTANAATSSVSFTSDLKLFQYCRTAPDTSQCQSYGDVLTPGSAHYCPVGDSTSTKNDQVLWKIRGARGLAVMALLALLVHLVVGVLYAVGAMQTRIPLIFTALIPCGFVAGALFMWGRFLGTCDKSYCQAYVDQYGNVSASCGPAAGLILLIIAGIVNFICIWPLYCVTRPGEQTVAVYATTAPMIQPGGAYEVHARNAAQPVYVAQPGYQLYSHQSYGRVDFRPAYAAQPATGSDCVKIL
jgi:hypothetical protein